MEILHIPVLVKEILYFLDPKPKGVYVDATVGEGGHSEKLLQRYPFIEKLICIDQDLSLIHI